MTKMPPCCAKYVTQERTCRAEIARLTRIIINKRDAAKSTTRFEAQLATEKANLAELKQIAIDHEADHAEAVSV